MSLSRFVLCSCLLVLLMGCGGESSSTISGKISHKGKDLNSGTILFQAASGEVESTQIQSDGTYTVSGLPKGSAKISVNVLPAPMPGPGGVMTAEPGTFEANPVQIPKKYDNVAKSGLTVELAGGAQTHDIVLE
ncbi:MAG: hypothetical protein COA78_19905 [Blastopirellula sp.]|nr:MAG: hypothetical protein COA78_19905 [Blastopirellula sp.]